jgi:hypothetical protein
MSNFGLAVRRITPQALVLRDPTKMSELAWTMSARRLERNEGESRFALCARRMRLTFAGAFLSVLQCAIFGRFR